MNLAGPFVGLIKLLFIIWQIKEKRVGNQDTKGPGKANGWLTHLISLLKGKKQEWRKRVIMATSASRQNGLNLI